MRITCPNCTAHFEIPAELLGKTRSLAQMRELRPFLVPDSRGGDARYCRYYGARVCRARVPKWGSVRLHLRSRQTLMRGKSKPRVRLAHQFSLARLEVLLVRLRRLAGPISLMRGGGANAACAWLVRRCQEAGRFEPPEHLRPRAVGRPRKVVA